MNNGAGAYAAIDNTLHQKSSLAMQDYASELTCTDPWSMYVANVMDDSTLKILVLEYI